ncbi:MAG: RsmB/NOP family class I SAM-dependent RNA methyltransferase, partial [Gammaproteobacteria bacterium]|nr:RsmB/NOP family class I SAM-dependent RNA methyltransferase [Gammaproteobacteria bacterium]
KRSLAYLAGDMSGRALVSAHQFKAGEDVEALFSGDRFAPDPMSKKELAQLRTPNSDAPLPVALDFPDFLLPELMRSLGDHLSVVLGAMGARAPVDLRVNSLKATVDEAERMLARDLIFTEPHSLAENALRITQNPRKLARSLAYDYGLVELQDVSSQAVATFCNAKPEMTVLDYCAGGGGKTLALAAEMQGKGKLLAHDANARRMKDLPERARRAGAAVQVLSSEALQQNAPVCDLVVVDAPCTGTGAWRRNPDGKWRTDQSFLDKVTALQSQILDEAARYVCPGGVMAYATCSILKVENSDQVQAFLARTDGWKLEGELSLTPVQGGDGFYAARLRRK